MTGIDAGEINIVMLFTWMEIHIRKERQMMISKWQVSGHMMCDPVYVLLPEKNTPKDQVDVISRH